MFQAYYSDSEPLFKSIQMCEDATSMKTFMNMIFKQMEGMIGFCAIREGSNEIVGVLIASLFKKFNWIIKKGVCMHMYMISKISHHRIKKKSFIILFPKFRFYYLRFFAKFINSKKKKRKRRKINDNLPFTARRYTVPRDEVEKLRFCQISIHRIDIYEQICSH